MNHNKLTLIWCMVDVVANNLVTESLLRAHCVACSVGSNPEIIAHDVCLHIGQYHWQETNIDVYNVQCHACIECIKSEIPAGLLRQQFQQISRIQTSDECIGKRKYTIQRSYYVHVYTSGHMLLCDLWSSKFTFSHHAWRSKLISVKSLVPISCPRLSSKISPAYHWTKFSAMSTSTCDLCMWKRVQCENMIGWCMFYCYSLEVEQCLHIHWPEINNAPIRANNGSDNWRHESMATHYTVPYRTWICCKCMDFTTQGPWRICIQRYLSQLRSKLVNVLDGRLFECRQLRRILTRSLLPNCTPH